MMVELLDAASLALDGACALQGNKKSQSSLAQGAVIAGIVATVGVGYGLYRRHQSHVQQYDEQRLQAADSTRQR